MDQGILVDRPTGQATRKLPSHIRELTELWDDLEQDILPLIGELNMQNLQKVLDFLCYDAQDEDSSIRTGLLLTGVNTPDIDQIFSQLSHCLPSYTCILRQHDAVNTANSIISALLKQVSCPRPLSFPNSLRNSYLELAEGMYLNNLTDSIVLMIPCVESIPSKVLSAFITTTANQLKELEHPLKISFLFGVASTVDSFLDRLPNQAISHLAIKTFNTMKPLKLVHSVIEHIYTATVGFHPNQQILSFLIDDIFLCSDYSIKNFLTRFKFIALDHYSCPFFPHLINVDSNKVSQYLSSLNKEETTQLYKNVALPDQKPETLLQSLKDQWILQLRAPILLHWIASIFSSVQSSNKCQLSTFIETYRLWLEDKLCPSTNWSRTMNSIASLSREAFVRLLECSKTIIKERMSFLNLDNDKEEFSPYLALIEEEIGPESVVNKVLKSLDCWLEAAQSLEESTESKVKVETLSSVPKRKMSLRDLKQHLGIDSLVSKTKEMKLSSPWSEFTGDFTRWLTACFSSRQRQSHQFISYVSASFKLPIELTAFFLPSPKLVPAFEVVYGCASRLPYIKQCLQPTFQKDLHLMLLQPQQSMASKWDLSVALKIYSECPSGLINLYDWLVAFNYVLSTGNETSQLVKRSIQQRKKEHEDKENIESDDDEELQVSKENVARFLGAVASLDFMGYVRSTKKKKDHLAKKIWNSSI
ncbi:hypothetical protein Ciccas_004972 [Cichlidogyrus casuarinus]|uniref:Origin recognition complex subunit 3 n=1 Tax=Cichlidogyrus casuarinus TaxID=1844966 RepID=A0ABD2Q9Y4_9PLAT